MNLFPIFSRRLVVALEKLGFKVVKMAPNKFHKELTVYYFEETPALRQAVQKLINK